MKRALSCVAVGALFVMVLAIWRSAAATTGTMIVTKNTTLREDHQGRIIIEADKNGRSVTLNCKGHTVSGNPALGPGIELVAGRRVTVRNCKIRGFAVGLSVVDSDGNRFLSNEITDSTGPGCEFTGALNNTVSGGALFNNAGGGCVLTTSSFNLFTRVGVAGNGRGGFILDRSTDNALRENEVVDNDSGGFDLISSDRNTVQRNLIVGGPSDAGDAIELVNSRDNTINANQVDNVARTGVSLSGSSRNRVTGNTANGNGGFGFNIASASNDNRIAGNSACNNTDFDANQESSSGNVFDNNRFCRTNGI